MFAFCSVGVLTAGLLLLYRNVRLLTLRGLCQIPLKNRRAGMRALRYKLHPRFPPLYRNVRLLTLRPLPQIPRKDRRARKRTLRYKTAFAVAPASSPQFFFL